MFSLFTSHIEMHLYFSNEREILIFLTKVVLMSSHIVETSKEQRFYLKITFLNL